MRSLSLFIEILYGDSDGFILWGGFVDSSWTIPVLQYNKQQEDETESDVIGYGITYWQRPFKSHPEQTVRMLRALYINPNNTPS